MNRRISKQRYHYLTVILNKVKDLNSTIRLFALLRVTIKKSRMLIE